MGEPAVTVVMPTYNRAWCLRDAIDSAMQIRHVPIELIVVDDGSTDDTHELLAEAERREAPRLKVVRHARGENRGIAASRNLGIALARAPILSFLDSDDLYLPQRFDWSLVALESCPSLDAVIEPYETLKEGDVAIEHHLTTLGEDGDGAIPALPALLAGAQGWNVPSITVRCSAIRRLGGFVERFRVAEDTALWLRLAASSRIGVAQCGVAVTRIRRHDEHSWAAVDEDSAWLTYLDVLADTHRFFRQHPTWIDPTSRDLLSRRVRSYLIETLTRSQTGRRARLSAWWRAVSAMPGLTLDRAILINMLRNLVIPVNA